MPKIIAEWHLCQDCFILLVNDELPSDFKEGDLPPLWNLNYSERARLVPGCHEHSEYCTEEDRQEGCDCGHDPFADFNCVGHAQRVIGDRYDVSLFDQ